MNKSKLQTQTGAGRLVTLTMNIPSRKSAWVTVDLLQISTICFISAFTYEWLKTQKGRLEVGEGMNIDESPVCRGLGGEVGAAEWCLPFKCPSSVQPVREERQCRWQLVTETAGCPTSPCLWSAVRWHLAPKKKKESGKKHLWLIKTAGQTPCLRQQDTNATRTPGWHVRQYLLCHSGPLLLLPPSICPSSSPHPPASGHWGLSAKPSNLSALSFLPPQIWIWKGTLSYPVKDHHFNDIWQSFDLLGFRGRGEEIH